ncbi:mannose-specific lectin 3-like [Ananas comosus]|uniref:non-specific serine/threonine protein kinase n=2 Tax=Ananas comosus TaxID=4615 RepID=A0A6P5G086_ANACO|nr:mannose-specific lectin 3-like [Ananas comosus]CAD1817664.1 unnamed protein product [Ananas comosus var. bracteatus]
MAIQIPFALLTLSTIFLLLPPYTTADYVLYNGEVLMAGQNLTNGYYRLTMQPNCDLVLYDNYDTPIWQTNTAGGGQNCYVTLKPNGEMVVRRDVHYTLWSSASKSKKGKYALVLNSNGRLGIYGQRRWSSNNQKDAKVLSRSEVKTEYVLFSGQRLSPPRKLKYRNYSLGFSKCNLVIRDERSEKALWQTNTDGNDCYLQLENDGELSVKRSGERVWSSNKRGESGEYIAVLRFDGRLHVYGPQVWSNESREDSELLTASPVVGVDSASSL